MIVPFHRLVSFVRCPSFPRLLVCTAPSYCPSFPGKILKGLLSRVKSFVKGGLTLLRAIWYLFNCFIVFLYGVLIRSVVLIIVLTLKVTVFEDCSLLG